MPKLERRQQGVAGAEDLAGNNRQRNNGSGSSVFARAQYHVGWPGQQRRTVDDDATVGADQKQQKWSGKTQRSSNSAREARSRVNRR